MKKTISIIGLALALSARAQISYVGLTSLSTNSTSSSAVITIPGLCTNFAYTVVNSNNVIIGDPIPTAFAKVNSSFVYVSNTLASLSALAAQINNGLTNGAFLASTNGLQITPEGAGPAWVTNGLSFIWNSNKLTTWLRTSESGQTTWVDHLLATH